MEQTARDILKKRLGSLNTKENNKAGLETQLALILQAAELAMHDYAEAYAQQKIAALQSSQSDEKCSFCGLKTLTISTTTNTFNPNPHERTN